MSTKSPHAWQRSRTMEKEERGKESERWRGRGSTECGSRAAWSGGGKRGRGWRVRRILEGEEGRALSGRER